MDISSIKSKVLQDLIEAMEERESSGLKSKSPKFMKVETNDPEMAEGVVESAMDNKFEREEKPSEPNEDDDMERMMELMSKKFSK